MLFAKSLEGCSWTRCNNVSRHLYSSRSLSLSPSLAADGPLGFFTCGPPARIKDFKGALHSTQIAVIRPKNKERSDPLFFSSWEENSKLASANREEQSIENMASFLKFRASEEVLRRNGIFSTSSTRIERELNCVK